MKRSNAFCTLAALSFSLLAVAPSLAEQPNAAQGPKPETEMMGPGMGPGMMGQEMMGPGMMGQGMGRGGMMGMMGGGCPMMGMMMGRNGPASAFAEGRTAFIKAELAITDAQKSVWDAYATALRKNLESMQTMHNTVMSASSPATPVERLDLHISAMESRLQSLKEVKPALSALYAALSADQKKTADDLLTGMGCMM
jgi:LTXXQ motif family protein